MIAGSRRATGALFSTAVLVAAFALAMVLGYPAQAQAAQVAQAETQLTTAAQATDEGAIEPGVYYIQSALPGTYMLDVASSSKAKGANAQIEASNGLASQRWIVARMKDGSYAIRCANSKRYLDLSSYSVANGVSALQYYTSAGNALHWTIAKSGSAYVISPKIASGYALDVAGAYAGSGANVQVFEKNGTDAQKWLFVPVGPKVESERTVANGIYEIRLASKSSYVLDVAGSSISNGANVQLQHRMQTASQRWIIRWGSDGFYSVRNLSTGKMLAATSFGVGANAVSDSASKAKLTRWAIAKNKNGSVTLTNKASGMVLDVVGAKAANGTNAQVAFASNGASQRFKLTECTEVLSEGTYMMYSLLSPAKLAVGMPGTSTKVNVQAQIDAKSDSLAQRFCLRSVGENTFMIQCVGTGRYLADVKGKVLQQKRTGKAAQKWTVSLDGASVVFTNVATGKRLAVAGGKAENGAKLITAKASEADAQRFRMVSSQMIPDGYYEIRSTGASSKRLEVKGGSLNSGANVRIYAGNSTAAQAWKVVYAGSGYYKILNDGSGLALEVAGASKKARANVQQGTPSKSNAQLWEPKLREDGTMALVNRGSGMQLEVAGTANKANVRQGKASNAAKQGWRFVATSSRSLSGNPELDAYARSIASDCGYSLSACFNWVTSNIRWQNSVSGEILPRGIADKQKTIDLALYAYWYHRGDCYYYASAFLWLARACGYSAEMRCGWVPSASSGYAAHGWVEVYTNGGTYICDPNLAVDIGGGYNWYMTTYATAPVQYYL